MAIVTDSLILKVLQKQFIDPNTIEFYKDYASRIAGEERSPYAKFYRSKINPQQRWMVVSGLPMVDSVGFRNIPLWLPGTEKFTSENNIFNLGISKTGFRLACLSDQPDGRKSGDYIDFLPRLYSGGSEIKPTTILPTLLETDPFNPNMHYNVLEWDYGICKRWMRLIQGRYHGYWAFTTTPTIDLEVRYNQIGAFRLKLDSRFKVDADKEVIPAGSMDVFPRLAGYVLLVGDSATFNPDASPETSSVDGFLFRNGPCATWANTRGGAGTGAIDDSADDWSATLGTQACASGNWYYFYRGLLVFDTSTLPDNANISDAVLSVYGTAKQDTGGWAPALGVVEGVSASNTALAAADFISQLNYVTRFATDITYAGYSITGYNDLTLNADGRNNISKTDVSKFCLKGSFDIDNSGPTWATNKLYGLHQYYAEQGAGYKPKLVVTYTVPSGRIGAEYTLWNPLGVNEF